MKKIAIVTLKTFLVYFLIGGILQFIVSQEINPLNWKVENVSHLFTSVIFLAITDVVFLKTKLITKE